MSPSFLLSLFTLCVSQWRRLFIIVLRGSEEVSATTAELWRRFITRVFDLLTLCQWDFPLPAKAERVSASSAESSAGGGMTTEIDISSFLLQGDQQRRQFLHPHFPLQVN